MTRRHYWKHMQSGDSYAVDLAGLSNDVCGASESLHVRDITADNLAVVAFDADADTCAWLEQESAAGHIHELEAPYPGDQL